MSQGKPQHHHATVDDICQKMGAHFGRMTPLKTYLDRLQQCELCAVVLSEVEAALAFLEHDDAALAEEARTCHEAYGQLMRLDDEERRRAIQSFAHELAGDVCTYGLATLLLEKARDEAPTAMCRQHVELAAEIFKRLDEPTYGRFQLFDLSARIHATAAHVELRDGESLFAEVQLEWARHAARQGTGSAHELVESIGADYLDFKGRAQEADDLRRLMRADPQTLQKSFHSLTDLLLSVGGTDAEKLYTRALRKQHFDKEAMGLRGARLDSFLESFDGFEHEFG